MRVRTTLRSLACTLLAGLALPAQDAARAGSGSDVAQAITEWVRDYERGRVGPKGVLRSGAGLQPGYVAHARRAGLLGPADEDRLTHLDALQKLLFFAEAHPSAAQAEAVLGLCAAGLEASFLDHEALQLREMGCWSMLRMDSQDAWFLVLRAASGDRVPVLGEVRDAGIEASLPWMPARRAAALRLLGMKNLPVFRSTIEAALTEPDPRVRLAAVEAMELQRRPDALAKVVAALPKERHPVVSQALVRLLLALLRAAGPELDAADRQAAVQAAVGQFGRSGWRTDMDLLDLVEAYPQKEAIPTLIDALDLTVRSPDALVTAINKRASPLLRERAAGLLRAMTGALIAADDPKAWREFWRLEQQRIVVPGNLARDEPLATRATFFGVPVTGASIAFLIDTSGSMDEAPAGTSAEPTRRSRATTRLRAAKEQLVAAAQAMPAESQYIVVTFAAEAHVWTRTPVKPGPGSLRSLTELLSRLRAHGGTNLFDGLSSALFVEAQRYGEPVTTQIDELFVLTDGEPTAGEVQDTETLLRIVREANQYAKVRINTVFTGTGDGAVLLRRLAEENGGVFVQR